MISAIIPADSINDISDEVLQPDGKIKLMPAEEWRKYRWHDFRAFCHLYARYGIPTTELINFLHMEINHQPVLEIGAGAGDLGHHLSKICGVAMTDSRQQENPLIKAQYDAMKQPVIKYPPEVEGLEALIAVHAKKPKVVIASWVTTYAPHEMPYGSNPFGIKEPEILSLVDKFILIGNIDTHGDKPIMKIKHEEYYFDWLVSRGRNQHNNRIWIWNKPMEKMNEK